MDWEERDHFSWLQWIALDSMDPGGSGITDRAAFSLSIKFNFQSCCHRIVQLNMESFELAEMDSNGLGRSRSSVLTVA